MRDIIRIILRLSLVLICLGVGLGVLGAVLVGTSIYLRINLAAAAAVAASTDCESCRPARYPIRQLPSPVPADPDAAPLATAVVDDPVQAVQEVEPAATDQQPDTPTPTPTQSFLALGDAVATPAVETGRDKAEARSVMTPTLVAAEVDVLPIERAQDVLTASVAIATDEESGGEAVGPAEGEVEPVEPYTSTNQVEPRTVEPEEASARKEAAAAPPALSASGCPTRSEANFDLIPIEGRPLKDHPGAVHGDLNLVLRGYIPTYDTLALVDYEGNTDADPPQLAGLFEPNRLAQISSVYRVNDWIWDSGQCGGHPRGCPGPPAETFWAVTLTGLATTPGEAIYTPERGAQIYSGGYVAMVLYAEERRLTLVYTRRDSVATGYVVHIEDVCVNPNLIALYQAQLDGAGWIDTGRLPALRNNQALGIAPGPEIKVAVRDAGSFMDPRSRKDWWR